MDVYDFFQNFSARDARKIADKADVNAQSVRAELQRVYAQIDHLSLVCLAMCELLEDVGFNKSRLLEKIQEIDLRDGKIDKKIAITSQCSGCGRDIAPRHLKCMYCGTDVNKVLP